MKPMFSQLRSSILLGSLLLVAGGASAQEFYVSGSLGQSFAPDVTTDGTFGRAFTTGTVTGVNPPLTLPAGAPVFWDTSLDDDLFYSLAVGLDTDFLRYEFEYSRADFDVSSHRGVTAGGIALGAIDAGVLIGGNVGDLGVSVANLVASDSGQVETHTYMVNAYYDFDLGLAFTPYVGIGLGNTTYDVSYVPGGVSVIDDESNKFTWQLMAGASYDINDALQVYASWRFRDGENHSSGSTLLPARFKLDMDGIQTLDVGIRYAF